MLFVNPQWSAQYQPDFTKPFQLMGQLIRSCSNPFAPEATYLENPYRQVDQDALPPRPEISADELNAILSHNLGNFFVHLIDLDADPAIGALLRFLQWKCKTLTIIVVAKWQLMWFRYPGASAGPLYTTFIRSIMDIQDGLEIERIAKLLTQDSASTPQQPVLSFLQELQTLYVQRFQLNVARRCYFSLKLICTLVLGNNQVREFMFAPNSLQSWVWLVSWLDDEMEKQVTLYQGNTVAAESNLAAGTSYIVRSASAVDLVQQFRDLGIFDDRLEEDDDVDEDSSNDGNMDHNGNQGPQQHYQNQYGESSDDSISGDGISGDGDGGVPG